MNNDKCRPTRNISNELILGKKYHLEGLVVVNNKVVDLVNWVVIYDKYKNDKYVFIAERDDDIVFRFDKNECNYHISESVDWEEFFKRSENVKSSERC